MIDLGGLISTILGFGTSIGQEKLQRNELVIKLLKKLGLDPDHPPADFTAVYQYTLVEYGIGKPRPVLDIFRQPEIQQIFRRSLDRNNPAILLKDGEDFLAGHNLGDELQALGLNARREFYEFAAVFIEVAKRTRTPAEVLTNQRLDSLHRQIGVMQERLNRLPTLEGMRTEMARLVGQDLLELTAAESNLAKRCRAFALAQQMRGWFETLGYRFETYEVWEDDYFEWIINVPVRRNRFDRILVRGIAGEVGFADVTALQQSVTNQRTDEGWLVTARRISRAARDEVEKPENRHLDCYTFDELVDLDADFSGYIDWLDTEIQRRGIATQYVPLACTKEELDPVTKQRLTTSRYDDRDGWIDGYIDRWLDDSAKEHISVLGEFGTGKTWFAFHYAWVALQRYQEAKERGTQRPRLPLVMTLRDYAKALNVENVLAGFFFTQHNIRLNSEVFDQLNRMGKLLLIFDGFDEMAAKVDKQQMINNFWELAKVVVPGAKVILTCRTEHFPEAQEGRALLNAELQASTANLTGETPQFEVLELEKFTDEQIQQVLSFQATPATVSQVMGNPQLLDLARRPVMTELILEALPDIEAGKPVDMSRVYLYAVRRKMERDIKAERTFTSLADKLYFLCELSWEMLSTDQMSLNYRLFPDRIRKLFGPMVQEEKDLDHWHYDMMGQTMLIRNADGDYAPAHRSLLEFFVAYKFAAELGALAPDFLELAQMRSNLDESMGPYDYTWSSYFQNAMKNVNNLTKIAPLGEFSQEPVETLRSSFGQYKLSKAVIDLITPITNSTNQLFKVLQLTQYQSEDTVGYIGGNAATVLVKKNKHALEQQDCSQTVILGADLSNASLRHANFSQAKLSQSLFSEAFGDSSSVAFSFDGTLIAVGSGNGTIVLLDAISRKKLKVLVGHSNWVRSVAFSPDGTLLASGSSDKTICLWSIPDGECLQTLCAHADQVIAIAFSPDGNWLGSTGADTTIKIWDVKTGQCLNTFEGHTQWVRALAVSPAGDLIASGCCDQTIRLWSVKSGQCLNILNGHSGDVNSLQFSLTGDLLFSGSSDQTVKIWQVPKGQCLQTLHGHSNLVWAVAVSPSGDKIATASPDKTIRIWDATTYDCLKVLFEYPAGLSTIAFSPISNILVSVSSEAAIRIWNLESHECLETIYSYTNDISCISFYPDGTLLASGRSDSMIRLWSISQQGQYIKGLQGHLGRVNALTYSPRGDLLASGSSDRSIRLWNVQTNQCVQTLEHQNCIRSVAFSPSGEILAVGEESSAIHLWNTDSGNCIKVLDGHKKQVLSVAFDITGDRLLSGSSDNTLRLWDIQSGKCIQIFEGHQEWVRSVAFSPFTNQVASACSDSTVFLWDIESGQCQHILRGHTDWANSVVFSPLDRVLISGSADHTIRVWDVPTGKCLRVLQGHTNVVLAMTFSPDGEILATSGSDDSIRFWNIRTGECLNVLADRPYEGMNITGVTGLTEAEKATLKALGAIEEATGET